jgi:lipopolysaccharide/colanic/teichoic acid biosynthesis glycosyltransferase
VITCSSNHKLSVRTGSSLEFYLRQWHRDVVRPRSAALVCKRILDVLGALTLLVVLAPLFLLVAVLIKLTSRGPILYWQNRVGRGGVEFPFPKFRSMTFNADQLRSGLLAQNDRGDDVAFKMQRDPRVTWLGRILRRLSIDELPQLWSVLIGDMSLVGPRPALPAEVARYTTAQRRRLDVTPGLTCIWQVSGRADLPFARQVEMDLCYIRDWTLWLDFYLLIRTIPAVLLGRGAY